MLKKPIKMLDVCIFHPLSLWKSITFLIRVRVQQLRKPVSITCFVIWSNNKVWRPDFKLQRVHHKICQITCGFQTFIRKLNTNTLRSLLQGNSRLLSQSMKEPEFVHQQKLKGKFIKFGWSLHYRWQTQVQKFVICLLKSDIIIVSRITSKVSR